MRLVSRTPVDTAAPRMAKLAVLPVFLDLAGRLVVVAGGTAAAAWKAELAAAAGALVAVFAATPCEELVRLCARPDGPVLHRRQWRQGDLEGAALAIADAVDEADAASFAVAARRQGAIVNVIDRPEWCQVQFGAIVNRSPLVVGISSSGGAPILAQAVRQRIDALLPAGLAGWAGLAKQLRSAVALRMPAPARRRQFWEALAARAFGAAPTPELGMDELEAALDAPRPAGRVTLVGAGPGDAGLLTLAAVRAMQSADVILHDDLVSREVLELGRREARRIAVGKRGGGASCAQDAINTLMADLARAGRHVVRLKSGDPMLFGRAGEELAALAADGIEADVVPGITAASAMAARLGISLTHRAHAHSVQFVTGHGHAGGLPEAMDWAQLAGGGSTLVFYMGGRNTASIVERLRHAGMSAATPCVVVAGVSREDEYRWHGRLDALATGTAATPAGAPVLIGIGLVFAAAAGLIGPEVEAKEEAALGRMTRAVNG